MKKIFFLVLNLIILAEVGFSANVRENSAGIEITDIKGALYFQIPVCNEWVKDCHVVVNSKNIGELVPFGASTFISAFKEFREEKIPFDMYYVKDKSSGQKIEFKKDEIIELRLTGDVLYDGAYATDGNGGGFVYIRNLRLKNEPLAVSEKRMEITKQCKKSLANRILEKIDTSISTIPLESFREYHQYGKYRKYTGTSSLHINKGDYLEIPRGYLCIVNLEVNRDGGKKYTYIVSFDTTEYDEGFFICTDKLISNEKIFIDHGINRIFQDIVLRYKGKGSYLDKRDMREVECFVFDLVSKEELDEYKMEIAEKIQDIKDNPQKYSYLLYK